MAGENEITGILNKAGSYVSAETKDAIVRKPVTVYGVVNASGKLRDSVRYDLRDGVCRVYALDYIYYVEQGRKPGKRPPRKAIEQWITDKGIIPDKISKQSLAYLIAKKIGEEGTTAHKQGGTKLLADIVGADFRSSVQSELLLTFKEKTNTAFRSAITGK